MAVATKASYTGRTIAAVNSADMLA